MSVETSICTVCMESCEDVIKCPKCETIICHACLKNYILANIDVSSREKCPTPDCGYIYPINILATVLTPSEFWDIYFPRRVAKLVSEARSDNKDCERFNDQFQFIKPIYEAIWNTKYGEIKLNETNKYMTRNLSLVSKYEDDLIDDKIPADCGRENISEALYNVIYNNVKLARRPVTIEGIIENIDTDDYYGMKHLIDFKSIPHKKYRSYKCMCANENCRGFVYKESDNASFNSDVVLLCNTCGALHCPKCLKELVEDHVCNSEDLDSELICNETKPCPVCKFPIYRLEGCPQMFCTACHSCFDWNSAEVIKDTRYFHNEHYFDYIRTIKTTNRNERGNCESTAPTIKYLQNLLSAINHISLEECKYLSDALEPNFNKNEIIKFKILYSNNLWNDDFKVAESVIEHTERLRIVAELYYPLYISFTDLLRNLIAETKSETDDSFTLIKEVVARFNSEVKTVDTKLQNMVKYHLITEEGTHETK